MSGRGIFKNDIFWVENFEKVDFLKSVGNCFGGVGKVFGGSGNGFWGLARVGDEKKNGLGSPSGAQNSVFNFS